MYFPLQIEAQYQELTTNKRRGKTFRLRRSKSLLDFFPISYSDMQPPFYEGGGPPPKACKVCRRTECFQENFETCIILDSFLS